MSESIAMPCPACGLRTLFIGSGGHLTCSWLECKSPSVEDAIKELKKQRANQGVLNAILLRAVETAHRILETDEAYDVLGDALGSAQRFRSGNDVKVGSDR